MFAFKRNAKATGLAERSYGETGSIIKIKKLQVGNICAPTWSSKHNGFKVMFMVVDDKKHCGWRWVTLKKETAEDSDMRAWLKDKYEEIIKLYELHKEEPWD